MFKRHTLSSKLYSQNDFYKVFSNDLKWAGYEVIIESPFITSRRFNELLPTISTLRHRGVRVIVNTRNPEEHDHDYAGQAYDAIMALQELDVAVLYTTKLHRKLAIIDRKITWEGSLNILSFSDSCELMRRHVDESVASSTIKFLNIY